MEYDLSHLDTHHPRSRHRLRKSRPTRLDRIVTGLRKLYDDGTWLVGLTVAMFIASIHTFFTGTLVYDQTLPIANLTQIPLRNQLKAGETFEYVARFDKRPDCKVTRGGYSIKGTTAAGENFSLLNFTTATYGTWKVGQGQTARAGVGIPRSVPPGVYSLWWKYCWICKGARGELCVPPDRQLITAMPITIVE